MVDGYTCIYRGNNHREEKERTSYIIVPVTCIMHLFTLLNIYRANYAGSNVYVLETVLEKVIIMTGKVFKVTGKMKITKLDWQNFAIEVAVNDEKAAREYTYSVLGSRHKLKRQYIKIETIKEISLADVKNPYIKSLISGGK